MKPGTSNTKPVMTDVPVKKPNFLIIGAAKSGTTTVWHHLAQHPQVYMSPRKHTRFFAFDVEDPGFRGPGLANEANPYAIADIEAYHALFEGVTDETAIGEASHSYLYQPKAAGRIKEYSPNMKLVAMLRNPAGRAYSHYMQMRRDGREPLTNFVQALEAEEARIHGRWWPDFHYVHVSLYHGQLQRYYDLFERYQIKVYLYEDFATNPHSVMRDMFRFLNVDDSFVPEASLRYNASGVPKNKAVHGFLQRLRLAQPYIERVLPEKQSRRLLRIGSSLHNRNLVMPPKLSPRVRSSLNEAYFREDILKLQELIQRDLSAWLE